MLRREQWGNGVWSKLLTFGEKEVAVGIMGSLTPDRETPLIVASQLPAEIHTAGILSGLSVTSGYDSSLRRTRLCADTATAFTNLCGYDSALRLTGVTNGALSGRIVLYHRDK